ncbi:hypothetical protein A2U01_0079370, partial [Trifolium medium]|nr:hypothetical protein [Trifolium medium]
MAVVVSDKDDGGQRDMQGRDGGADESERDNDDDCGYRFMEDE